MTNTANLGMPFIDGSQAQKHVTHNDALRILDAAVQIGVLTTTLTAPPSTPSAGDRHVVGASATGAWAGQAKNIATWEDGTWRFMTPKIGWFLWSAGDDGIFVYNGTSWRSLRDLTTALDNAAHIGVNTTASSPNLLTVRSNAALFNAIAVASGGTGDARVQISKESSAKTASVVFSDAFSGRAEFGLVGSDAFKLKVSNDGSTFVEALSVDQSSGNTTLPRGIALCGVISPAQITSNQNDYAPTSFATCSVIRISTDASRDITGLAGGSDGRLIYIYNAGSQNAVLKNASVSSAAANRFAFGADLTLTPNQGASLIYDAATALWRQVGGPSGAGGAGTVTSISPGAGLQNAGTTAAITSSGMLSLDGAFGFRNRVINPSGQIAQITPGSTADGAYTGFDQWLALTQTGAVAASQVTTAENGTPYMIRLTQSQASAQRFGLIQPLEAANVLDLRGKSVTLSARVRMSVSTTLRYAIVEWTGTSDSVTKDVVNDWTNATFTPSNFFISTTTTIVATGSVALTANALASISLTGTVSGSMNNLHVFFWTDSTQAQNVTLDISKVQLEQGLQATPLAFRSFANELNLCQRYYEKTYPLADAPGTAYSSNSSVAGSIGSIVYSANNYNTVSAWFFKQTKRIAPNVVSYSPYTGASGQCREQNAATDRASIVGSVGIYQALIIVNNVSTPQGTYLWAHATADARL